MRAAIAILAGISIILAGVLFSHYHKAEQEQKEARNQILLLSNEWVQTRTKLANQEQVNVTLETNLSSHLDALLAVSNKLVDVSNKLVDASGTLVKVEAEARAAAKAAQDEIAKRDARIAQVENQNEALDKQATDLKSSIGNLETQIADTQRKLAASEGDREFLFKELKRLQAEKAELERQFNDLAVLREQVRKLKEELSVARRLDWIRRGLYGDLKGGQRLQSGIPAPAPKTNYDLNVEIKREGGAKVVPPAPSTNAPAPAPK
jgi:chromosome segregation ATPase